MSGIESQKQALEPDKFDLLPQEPEKERELSEPEKKIKSARTYPLVRSGEQKKTESLKEDFRHQDFALISNNEVIARFHRGFPTKVIPKDIGVYEVLEKQPTGKVVSQVFDNIEEIQIG